MRSKPRAIAGRFSEMGRRWARRRQGLDPPLLTLASERIYILPTPAGLVYAVMLMTMLAGAMNYNNNLGFALTFLLAGVAIVAIYHTHRNLCGLRLHYLGAEPVFAGEPLEVRLSLVNDSREPRDEIFLDWDGRADVPAGVPALDSRAVRMPVATSHRGPMALPALRLATRAPLGLMRAWAWIHLDARPIVYPRPAVQSPPAQTRAARNSAAASGQPGDDDFAGLRDYHRGDSPGRIAWRSYARSGQLLVRDYRGGGDEPVWLDWDALPASDTETRVACLARLVIDAFEAGRTWGLILPGRRIAPATGNEQLHRCLHALAIVGLRHEARA
jgi:uncharacterized protein (DUF58 family)